MPIELPQWIGPDVPPRRWIIIAHPVLEEAAFRLKPLAGEAQVYWGAARHMLIAKRQIARRPDNCSRA